MKTKILHILLVMGIVLGTIAIPVSFAGGSAKAAGPLPFTILHTNDFHGQLEPLGSSPGMARVADVVNNIRTAKGLANVVLVDAGDEMQGSLLSNLGDGTPTGKGIPTIDVFNTMGYDVATFGNHEFDWGLTNLMNRMGEAIYPYVTANIVVNDTGDCTTAGWALPTIADAPYFIKTVGTAPDTVDVGFIGVTTTETPIITIASATAGMCFKDPAASILHHYDAMVAAGADVIVVLSHLGFNDGGYGYGIPAYGDKTLAQKLIDAGKPADLIIGGHSHTNLASAGATVVAGTTTVAQAYYNGRQLGQADLTFDPSNGAVTVSWAANAISTTGAQDPTIDALIDAYASDPDYLALINQPVGYAQTDLLRNYNGNSMMADFVDDAIYGALNNDLEATNDVDMFFNNAGGIRIEWCDKEDLPTNPGTYIWSSLPGDCQPGVWSHAPMLLNYGQMYQILPFGNATAVGEMTGAQIYDLLQQSATLFKGALQPAGLRYKFYRYSDSQPGPQPYAWGAYDIEVKDKATDIWVPLDMAKTYKVGTNEFLAPAGQDGFLPFKYLTNITYWGDMLDSVNAWVSANYTMANPYKGPNGDGQLDGRIERDGDGDDAYEMGEVVPLTILHHNDSHGRLLKSGSYQGYSQLVTLINQERLHNPGRTLLLTAGDNIQGDSMMYYFKSAGLGYAADGTVLLPPLDINPLIAAFNAVGYDAMTLGNHEFNFGKDVFSTLGQANFPMLQANIIDDGQYGLAAVPVEPYVTKTVGPEAIDVAILGIGNHRVPSYELPSNILGLTFTDPIQAGIDYAPDLQDDNDVVIALTHIGFTTDPKSVEVDNNVDTYFAAQVPDVDAVIGGHSHTNPATGSGPYKFLPTYVAGPNNVPVIINQAYRYNTNLGEIVLGLLPDGMGGYKVVSRAGRYIPVPIDTVEDPIITGIVGPYQTLINAYNNTVIGETITPIDTTLAFTQETNGANLQADASIWKLEEEGIPVDFHLSGAMTNRLIATTATPATPYQLKVSDMFAAMPYENSLVVLNMNGPQLEAVLERAYRNYFYYKYVPGYGGYSYYTTCMLDTGAGSVITYNDLPAATYDPNVDHVGSLVFDGHVVDFSDASTYYRVSTVNYLAAGACNFSESGVSLWPLTQIAADTQYYVRDAVIEYIQDQTAPINPQIEGRLSFVADTEAPVITINSPTATTYPHPTFLTLDFSAVDVGTAGLLKVWADLDGVPVVNGQVIDLLTLALGDHTLTVYAEDKAGNESSLAVTFSIEATITSLKTTLMRFYGEGKIDNGGIFNSLNKKLLAVEMAYLKGKTAVAQNVLLAFVKEVMAQKGVHITEEAADILIADAYAILGIPYP